eukprot:333498-Ditylum_brightwellii.AAC.1
MFRWVPLRWLTHILVNVTDNIKHALSRVFPETVIFVKALGYDDVRAFGEERGDLWKMREVPTFLRNSNDDVVESRAKESMRLYHQT